MFLKSKLVLIIILVLAASLRLWNLSDVPPSLTWDEAALGYNAYSILTTGRDEYGKLLPITLKSFGDHKPALYAYLDIPFVALFGLNELAVRLPSAIFGVLAIWVVYLLVMELFGQKRLAQSVSLMMAISPLAIQFSRPAFETNIAFGLNLAAILLFIKALKKPPLYFLSYGLFGLSLFAYQSSRLFVPIIFVTLLILYRRQIVVDRIFKISLGFWVVVLAVSALVILGFGQSDRLAALNLFSYPRRPEYVQLISAEDGYPITSWQFQVLHGEWWAYVRGLGQRYLLYFSPKMLFMEGDVSLRNRVPDLGLLYYFSAVLIPLGLYSLMRLKGTGVWLVLIYLLLSPIPAVLSRDLINVIRAYNLVWPLSFLEGAGLMLVCSWIFKLKTWLKWVGFGVIGMVMTFNIAIFLERYFIHAPIEYSQGWLYGYKGLFNYLDNLDLTKYQNIVITDYYGQPYIYYLFFSKYPPADYQKQAKLDQKNVDVGTVRQIDKYHFRWIDRWADRNTKNSLLVATPDEIKDDELAKEPEWKLLKEIKFLDGQTAFRVIETL